MHGCGQATEQRRAAGGGHARRSASALLAAIVLLPISAPLAAALPDAPAAATSILAMPAIGRAPGFVGLPAGARLLLLRLTLLIQNQAAGGTTQPLAEPTLRARAQLQTALTAALAARGLRLVTMAVPEAEAQALATHLALFDLVAAAAVRGQLRAGARLPSLAGRPFDWTLGPGLAPLGHAAGADYGLIVEDEDAFGEPGRKLAQLLFAGSGLFLESGVHRGRAALVRLADGALLWLCDDPRMGGDPRSVDGAGRRAGQLLAGLTVAP
ncbi:hypothetical protein [Sphingomonas morindae]|uniref:Uncharacterized protein n=1 Tax=Sphingomonas morindae TaxID=1541170 RepID=A0ABY4X8J8_9SPHN|nr:hypothetical protein [Sphingomonas morindae]USI73204.1 hypothetical protein LHA26_01615 [Sphingomonas morindae]